MNENESVWGVYPLAGLCDNTCNPPQSAQGTLALLDWICRRKPAIRCEGETRIDLLLYHIINFFKVAPRVTGLGRDLDLTKVYRTTVT